MYVTPYTTFLIKLLKFIRSPLIFAATTSICCLSISVLTPYLKLVVAINGAFLVSLIGYFVSWWNTNPIVRRPSVLELNNIHLQTTSVVVFVTHRPYGLVDRVHTAFYHRATTTKRIPFIEVRYKDEVWQFLYDRYTFFGPGVTCGVLNTTEGKCVSLLLEDIENDPIFESVLFPSSKSQQVSKDQGLSVEVPDSLKFI